MKQQKGFTLIELVIVIVIVTIQLKKPVKVLDRVFV